MTLFEEPGFPQSWKTWKYEVD